MKVLLKSKKLEGNISVPSSKSYTHRAIIVAMLANGWSVLKNISLSDDIIATLEIAKQLGAKVEIKENGDIKIVGNGGKIDYVEDTIFKFNESASTLRFIIPILSLSGKRAILDTKGELANRPLSEYEKIFDISKEPLILNPSTLTDDIVIDGNISSQFITGILFILPFINKKLKVKKPIESTGYIDITIDILRKAGIFVSIKEENDLIIYSISSGNEYQSIFYNVEGDYSQAAFWLVAKEFGNNINIDNIEEKSLQGDKEILNILKGFRNIKGLLGIDISNCPDLGPIIAVLSCFREGKTIIVGANRMRIKESDRIKAIVTELNKMGANILEKEDGMIIRQVDNLVGTTVDSWNDHRIAMSLAIASLKAVGDVEIINAECINKSYPTFWEEYRRLGGELYEYN